MNRYRVGVLCCLVGLMISGTAYGYSAMSDPSLIGWWEMNEGTGSLVSDSSGNGNDGIVSGTPTWVAGQHGGAILMENELIEVPAIGQTLTEATMAGWVKPNGSQPNWSALIFIRGDGAGTNVGATGLNINGLGLRYHWQGGQWAWVSGVDIADGEWNFIAMTVSPDEAVFYLDGVASATNAVAHPGAELQANIYLGGDGFSSFPARRFSSAAMDDVSFFSRALAADEIAQLMQGLSDPVLAGNPSPADEESDVLRNSMLSWNPGIHPATHDVYVGVSFEDVNSSTTPTASGLTASSFDPGRLEFGQTYFWRVDEVNVSADKTVHTGDVWSFAAEPYSISIPGDTIAASASSSSNEFSTPVKVIDGSGLGDDGTHGMSGETMWFTASPDLDPWIQFEFDGVKKLDTMKVWNSNSAAEMAIGWGVKDVEIAYSSDGDTWTVLEVANQFSRAPGSPSYNAYDEIDFGGAAAKLVRLNMASNWGGLLMSYSLSEVQFAAIPAAARTPEPVSGATDVVPNATLEWRAGREAAEHLIYMGTDANAVADASVPTATSSTNSLDLSSLDLDMGATYYWRVDEANEAEATPVWAGPEWNFSTAAALIVDDFESYGNASPDRPFQTWLDGFGYSADEFFSVAYPGNGTGAGIGHDIWSISSPHYDGDIMETSVAIAGSGKSMPFYFSNSGGVASQTDRNFASPQDWTVGAAQTLSIAFRGQAGNTGTLFAIINGVKLTYPHDPANIAIAAWQAWNIDLTAVNTNLQSVTTFSIGVDGGSASGMVLIDDIKLHAQVGELITPVDPGSDGLVAQYTFEGNMNDSSGNGNNGTVVGTDGTQIVSDPDRGQVLSLPGGNDQYVEIGAVGISGTMPRTIACWAKAANTEIPDWSLVFGFTGQADETGGNGSHFNIGSLGGPGGIDAHCWGWEETMVSDEEGLNWHDYAVSYDGTTVAYFVDGLAADTDPGKSNVQDLSASGDRVHIGSRVTQLSSFPGNVDDAVIYNRVLSAEEVLWIAGVKSPIDKPF